MFKLHEIPCTFYKPYMQPCRRNKVLFNFLRRLQATFATSLHCTVSHTNINIILGFKTSHLDVLLKITKEYFPLIINHDQTLKSFFLLIRGKRDNYINRQDDDERYMRAMVYAIIRKIKKEFYLV